MNSFIGRDYATFAVDFDERVTPEQRRSRLILLVIFCCAWSAVLFWRLFSLQVADFDRWQDWALKQHLAEVEVASERGAFKDRNGNLLATSIPASSIYIRPKQVKDKEQLIKELIQVLPITKAEMQKALQSNSPFVWIKRQISRSLADKVMAKKLDGVGTALESMRVYPYNHAASTLIGKVGLDGQALSGLEMQFDAILHAEKESHVNMRDGQGKYIREIPLDADQYKPPRGYDINLTIDANIQLIMDEELELGRKEAKAKYAYAIMIDSDSGEVLGYSQAPSFNLNQAKLADSSRLKNLLAETVFEPGSIMKPFVIAAALEDRLVNPNELIDCEEGRFRFAGHTIKDVHPSSIISLRDVLIRSSNIGMTKVGLRLGKQKLYRALTSFGFGSSSGLGIVGESAGLLRSPDKWSGVDVATHSFGQGVAVTPLQVVRAVAAIANGGKLPRLHLVLDNPSYSYDRVMSQATAKTMQSMLFGVVEDQHGTGQKAAVTGIRIGGKTGTAQKAKLNGRGYQDGAYVASFVGFADGSALGTTKNVSLLVIVDEPRGDSIYGGTVSAPIFSKVIARTYEYLLRQKDLGHQDDSGKLSVSSKLHQA